MFTRCVPNCTRVISTPKEYCCPTCHIPFLEGDSIAQIISDDFRPDHPIPFHRLATLLVATLKDTPQWQLMQTTHADEQLHQNWWLVALSPLRPELNQLISNCCQNVGLGQNPLITEDELTRLLQALESLPIIRRTFASFASSGTAYPTRRLPLILLQHLLSTFTVIPKRIWYPGGMADSLKDWIHDTTYGCAVYVMDIRHREALLERISFPKIDNYSPIDILRLTPQLLSQCRQRRLHTESLLTFLPRGVVAIVSTYAWLCA